MTTPYSRKVANLNPPKLDALIDSHNELVDQLASQGVIAHYQYKSTSLVTTPDAADLGTSKTLTKALALAMVAHAADTDIHLAADGTAQAAAWASAPAEPANLAEVEAVLNEIKGDINTHVAAAAAHRGVQGSVGVNGAITARAITTADATDQPTANALANAIKAFLNNHIKAAASSIEIVNS